MSVDIFWHVLFWHSTVCWHIRLACFVVHFIACIFAFWHCMRFHLLALFFAIVLSIEFWLFVAKILTFVFFSSVGFFSNVGCTDVGDTYVIVYGILELRIQTLFLT